MSIVRSVLLHLDAAPPSAARLEFARSVALRHEADCRRCSSPRRRNGLCS